MKRSVPIGLVVAFLGYFLCSAFGLSDPQCGLVAITLLCAVWWVSEAIPIPATSMIPFALFPFFQILKHKEVAASYGHHMILLLLGGFLLSKGLEASGVHKRFALGMIRMCGLGGKRLVLGFMLASALCSMWISNTATVLMLLPVALAVVDKDSPLCAPLFLGMAYAASIGGMATPIGTPPNMILLSQLGREIAFFDWMLLTLPAVLTFLVLAWLWLTRSLGETKAFEIPSLKGWRWEEVGSISVFALAASLWVFRKNPAGGWSAFFDLGPWVGDSSVAMLCAALLFVVPNGKGGALLNWEQAKTIPWGLLLLFGGGIAIAVGFKETGLSVLLGNFLVEDCQLLSLPSWLSMALLCLAVTFLTEVTSNTATTNLLMPILGAAAATAQIDPLLLMLPAALSASCAFMLPVATAPNAIVYGSERILISRMLREGVFLNFIGVVVIVFWLQWLL